MPNETLDGRFEFVFLGKELIYDPRNLTWRISSLEGASVILARKRPTNGFI